jgi:hypothetical protein
MDGLKAVPFKARLNQSFPNGKNSSLTCQELEMNASSRFTPSRNSSSGVIRLTTR